MDTVQEIERAIDALRPEQLEELSLWFEERYSQTVDERLKADIEADGSMSISTVRLPITKPEEANPCSAPSAMASCDCGFLEDYRALPVGIRERAIKQFALLKANPRHPSLQFKQLTKRVA